MSKKWKLITMIIAGYLVMVLLFTAFSDDIFYFTQEMKADSSVYAVEGQYEYYFHIQNDDKSIVIDFDIEKISDELALITVNITPKDNHRISALVLNFDNIIPAEAFLYEDPSGTYVNPYNREIGYGDKGVTINYPAMSTVTNEVVELEYWIDITKLDSVDEKFSMSFSIYMYENSLLKIWRYHAQSGVQLDMNS
jgi:hypothetical protein